MSTETPEVLEFNTVASLAKLLPLFESEHRQLLEDLIAVASHSRVDWSNAIDSFKKLLADTLGNDTVNARTQIDKIKAALASNPTSIVRVGAKNDAKS